VKQIIKSPAEVQVIDLVLDPFGYYDALTESIYQDQHHTLATAHLAEVLPAAIAQLDAVGDEYGVLALTGLAAQLARRDGPPLGADEARPASAYAPGLYAVAEAY
jgi:hypothetical protein